MGGARKGTGGARLTEETFRVTYPTATPQGAVEEKEIRSSFGMPTKKVVERERVIQGDTGGVNDYLRL